MLEHPLITLTTDFGVKDPFAGIMKGVISRINPKAHIIDISHNIAPHNILEASRIIGLSYKYFPPTTVHVAVVDPGVGGLRRPILVVAKDYYFVGPDNGIFTPIFEEHVNAFKVLHITASHYWLPLKGSTFHGRDIFAPVAAWLSRGVDSSKFGEEISDYVRLELPVPSISRNFIEGEVIYIDSFGNAITNITEEEMKKLETSKERFNVLYKGQKMPLSSYYSEAQGLGLGAVINSSGLIELFLFKGNASKEFGIRIGDKVSVKVI